MNDDRMFAEGLASGNLPAPIVADLNGDGDMEVIVASHDYKLKVIKPGAPARFGEGFGLVDTLAEVSLMPHKVAVASGRRPVAMAVGYLDPPPKEKVRPPHKQVLVVVTSSWHVMCFDHNLKLLWEHTMEENLPPHAHLDQVSVYISHQRVREGDRGVVVVGGSLDMGDLEDREGLEGADEDMLEEQLRMELEALAHSTSAGKDAVLENLSDTAGATAGVDTSRHFSYYCFEGAKGIERWRHDSKSFHKDLEELQNELVPQNNYRLDAERLNSRHFGEASCRDFRESVLFALPHYWASTSDTRLDPAYFVKHREGKGVQKHRLAATTTKGSRESQSLPHLPGSHSGSTLTSGGIARWFSNRGQTSNLPPLAKMTVEPPKPNHTINALVAHLQEGLEAIHLYTGRTLCELHLVEGALHVDLNGDGVMDHIQVYGGSDKSRLLPGDSPGSNYLGHCTAVATSGVPPMDRLFTIQLCHGTKRHEVGGGLLDGGNGDDEEEDLEFAPPVALPIPRMDGKYSKVLGRRHMLVFMKSNGEVGAYNYMGDLLWELDFNTQWSNQPGSPIVKPTLAAMALYTHAIPTTILAAGADQAVILSERGYPLAFLNLPQPPSHPLLVVDYNGDGLNDLILVAHEGIFGYQQVHHMGGLHLSALMLTMIIAMGVVYYTQQYEPSKSMARGRKVRSTEYTD